MASRESRRSSIDMNGLQILACKAFLEKVLSKVTPDTVDFVRDFIDQQLQYAGLVKRALREWCVYELYKKMSFRKKPPSVNTFAVMDCIIDRYFLSLHMCIPFPAFKSFSHLMAIITCRCPNLEELVVVFQNTEETFSENEMYTIPPGSQLPCLRSLTLIFPPGYDADETSETRDSLFRIVGKLCTVLTKLEVREFCMNKIDILALIVNAEMANILFSQDGHWGQDSFVCGLLLPKQFLNPLVSTMKELILCRTRAKDRVSLGFVFGFALRHLPKLENLLVANVRIITAVLRLYQQRGADQEPFEEAWREAASRLGLDVSLPVTLFSGAFSLNRLEHVPINDPDSLQAASELCPSITRVKFVEGSRQSSSSSDLSLEPILKSWSEKMVVDLDSVDLLLTDPNFVKMVLESFGPKIKTLYLNVGCDIDMNMVASNCTNLKNIAIHECKIIMDLEAASRWSPETFLPKLKGVYHTSAMDVCLGVWGLLLEKKSTLTHLSLRCCHIGTEAHNPRLEWSELPQLWTQLEWLEIKNCTGLTTATLMEIIPKFPKLRRIYLPPNLLSQDQRATLIRQRMVEGTRLEISFSYPLEDSVCFF